MPDSDFSSETDLSSLEVQTELGFMETLPRVELPLDSAEVSEEEAAELEAFQPEVVIAKPQPLPESEDGLPPSKEARVKLQLFGRPDSNLAELVQNHLESMENNAFFLHPEPSQADLRQLLQQFQHDCRDCRAAMELVRKLVAQKARTRRQLEHAMNLRGSYVQMESQGKVEAILSAGLEVRRKRQPIPPLPAPSNLQVVPDSEPGSMRLTWDKVKNAKMYRLQYGPAGGEMVEIPLMGRRRVKLSDLKIGRLYRFRIAAIGGATGQSPWSAAVERLVA